MDEVVVELASQLRQGLHEVAEAILESARATERMAEEYRRANPRVGGRPWTDPPNHRRDNESIGD